MLQGARAVPVEIFFHYLIAEGWIVLIGKFKTKIHKSELHKCDIRLMMMNFLLQRQVLLQGARARTMEICGGNRDFLPLFH